MKSKTSCFNRMIFKKNFTHYWPLWALYLGYLMLLMPVQIWQLATNKWYYEDYDAVSRMYEIVQYALETELSPFSIFLFSVVMALAVFSYLYSGKNANMMHALPVNRLELFVTNYLSGLSFLLVPEIIAFLVSVLVCLANGITCIQYLFIGLICQMGISFFAYSMAVFIAMFTGHAFAMPAYYYILNYLYVGCLYIVDMVKQLLCYGITDTWNPGKSCILSPCYYLGNNLYSNLIYDEKTYDITGIEMHGMYLVAIYAAVAVVLVVAAYQLYKRRQIETAGDFISIGIVKPIFRWGVALCGGMLVSSLFTTILKESHRVDVYICLVASIIVTGFLFFFAAEMLLQKHFKVFKKKRLIEWGGVTVLAILFFTLFEVDAFGIERKMPEESEIAEVFVNMDYPVVVDSEDIPQLLALHQQVIDSKKEYLEIEKGTEGYYYTTIRYFLKDGTIFERRYPLPLTEEYLEDEMSPTNQILAWEREEENLKNNILGWDYDTNEYLTGYIDVYDEEQNYQEYTFSGDEMKQIVAAIEKDIEEGNYDPYYLDCIWSDEYDYYYNNISLEYYNYNGYYDIWDYYECYEVDEGSQMERVERISPMRSSSYICFGPECTNTIETLEKLGAVDDTWKLWTSTEYFEAEME